MSMRNLILVFSTMLIAIPGAYGADLARTFTYTTADAYCWIVNVGADADSDSGTGNTSAVASVDHPDGTGVDADVDSLVTTPSSTATVACIDGDTATNSIYSPGYHDASNVWHQGTSQDFTGFVETESDVTSDGVLDHYVSFSFDAGGSNAEGQVNAWATVGNVQLYFTWNGGNTLTVMEYIEGVLIYTHSVTQNGGVFEFSASYSQTVFIGDTIEVDTYASLVDSVNAWNIPKRLTLLAGTQ